MSFFLGLFVIVFCIVTFFKDPKKALEGKCIEDKILYVGFSGAFVFFIIMVIGLIIEETYCTGTWTIWVPFGIMCAFLLPPIVTLLIALINSEQ